MQPAQDDLEGRLQLQPWQSHEIIDIPERARSEQPRDLTTLPTSFAFSPILCVVTVTKLNLRKFGEVFNLVNWRLCGKSSN